MSRRREVESQRAFHPFESTSEIFTEPSECVEVNIVMISHVVEYRQHFRIFDNTFIGEKI